MSASVEIQTERVANVISIPIEAVTVRPESALDTTKVDEEDDDKKKKSVLIDTKNEQEVVFVMVDGKAKIRKVKTGIQDDKFIQILEGINPGETIISGPYSAISKSLKHDDAVEEVSKEDLFEAKKNKEE